MSRTRKSRKTQNTNTTKSPNHKYGLIPVNNLTYGNPDAQQDLLVRKEHSFDYIANHYMDKPYPNNDGDYAKNELNQIKDEMSKLAHEKVVTMSVRFDEDLFGMCVETAEKCGVPNPQDFVESVFRDINPIIMKLKFYYNRIRPFQLANVYGFQLNPMPTVSAQSPSYPSGHTIQSKVIADILSFRYPDKQDMLMKFADKCSKSRIIMGVHFPSDEIFGLQISAGITNDENFISKYFTANKISDVQTNNNQGRQSHTTPEFRERPVRGGGPQMPDLSRANDVGAADPSGVFGGIPVPGQGPIPGR